MAMQLRSASAMSTSGVTLAAEKHMTIRSQCLSIPPSNKVSWTLNDLADVGKSLQSKWDVTNELGFLIVTIPKEYKVDAKLPDLKTMVMVKKQQFEKCSAGWKVTWAKGDKGKAPERMSLQEYHARSVVRGADIRNGCSKGSYDPIDSVIDATFEGKFPQTLYAVNLDVPIINPGEKYLNLAQWSSNIHTDVNSEPFVGISRPTAYYGYSGSCFQLHTEHGLLGAFNLQLFGDLDAVGSPEGKLWMFTRPQDWDKVKEKLKEEYADPNLNLKLDCTATHTHKTFLIHPKTFADWGIPVYQHFQTAGELVVVLPCSFHQGINVGTPTNIATNCYSPLWPDTYNSANQCAPMCSARAPDKIQTDYKGHNLFCPEPEVLRRELYPDWPSCCNFSRPDPPTSLAPSEVGSLDQPRSPSAPLNSPVPASSRASDTSSPQSHRSPSPPVPEDSVVARYSCATCGKLLKTKKILKDHVKIHLGPLVQRPFPCTLCLSRLRTRSELKTHLGAKHGGVKVPCGFCPLTFPSRSNMLRHARKFHPVVE